MTVASVQQLYIVGKIDEDQLERLLERELLRENRAMPVPDGWAPLAPCTHVWLDITTFGDRYPMSVCSLCGETSDTLSRPDRTG